MKKKNERSYRIITYSCAGIAILLTVYLMLDTFVIPKPYQTGVSAATASAATLETTADVTEADSEADSSSSRHSGRGNHSRRRSDSEDSENSTVSESADAGSSGISGTGNGTTGTVNTSKGDYSITVTEYTVADTQVYVADVEVTSALQIKTAFAEDTYGRNITAKTSEIAAANGAVLAINGDYYGAQESGYVIRNGVLYRDTAAGDTEILVIYRDGTVEIRNTGEVTAQELLDAGAWQVLSFGPALVENGEVAVDEDDEVGKAMADNPRTAIGIIDENHYLFVVSDGRTDESEGLTLAELAEFLQSLGAETAYNLDGGGSSTMYYEGEVINNPTTSGRSIKERKVSDIVYLG